jgi:DNA-binding PadR family transcriptional regulator
MSRVRSRRLSQASLYVVLALLDGESHGYELMRRVEDLSDGTVRMGPGTMYGTLARLVGDGLIVEKNDDGDGNADDSGGRPRRTYRLTGEGQKVAATEVERMRSLLGRLDRPRPATGTA